MGELTKKTTAPRSTMKNMKASGSTSSVNEDIAQVSSKIKPVLTSKTKQQPRHASRSLPRKEKGKQSVVMFEKANYNIDSQLHANSSAKKMN